MTAVALAPASPRTASLFGLDPATYTPHFLHGPDRQYPETNCYVDVLVELLHAHGDEPLAGLSCVLSLSFEGDQFTFFKPEPHVLQSLYGLDVHEMQPYRPLVQQAAEQLSRGRTMLVEVDGWFLPDTAATSYRRQHSKTTVAFESIDTGAERAHYFHNAGLHLLEGEDFRGALRVGVEPGSAALPPYTELARFDAGPGLRGSALREASGQLARVALATRPETSPFLAFAEQMPADLAWLAEGDAERAASYAFATVRMAGSAAEVAASYAEWLLPEAGSAAAQSLLAVTQTCKTLSFRLARRRRFDPAELLGQAAQDWADGLRQLEAQLGDQLAG